jgi:hypothetical protein
MLRHAAIGVIFSLSSFGIVIFGMAWIVTYVAAH